MGVSHGLPHLLDPLRVRVDNAQWDSMRACKAANGSGRLGGEEHGPQWIGFNAARKLSGPLLPLHVIDAFANAVDKVVLDQVDDQR